MGERMARAILDVVTGERYSCIGAARSSVHEDNGDMTGLADQLRPRIKAVDAYLKGAIVRLKRSPWDLYAASRAYFARPAKRLRPCLVMLAASACGGEEDAVVPAAAAVEVFHTWTLVHDDIIDADPVRRGGPAAHEIGAVAALEEFDCTRKDAGRYGRDVAILAGDVLQGWGLSMLLACADDARLDAGIVLDRARAFATELTEGVVRGEMLDIQLAMRDPETIRRSDVMRMMKLKTALLFRFPAELGASLALGRRPGRCPEAQALARFGEKCGLAFQLQDDILGVVGDPDKLGKPVGGDLRERKRTLVLMSALENANAKDRKTLLDFLGGPKPGARDIRRITDILRETGAIASARKLARRYACDGVRALDALGDSPSTRILRRIGEFMADRAV